MGVFKFRRALLAPLVEHNNKNNKEQPKKKGVESENWKVEREWESELEWEWAWLGMVIVMGMGYENWDSFNLIRHA